MNLILKFRKTVWLIRSKFYKPSEIEKRIEEIMGDDFFSIKDNIKHFGIRPKEHELLWFREELAKYSEKDLKKYKDTHILVTFFRISILEIRKRVDSKLFYKQDWYNNEDFAKEKGKVCWKLIRKTIVPNSTNKSWKEQMELIGKDEEVPTAQQMTYCIIGHYLKTGERLFEKVYVRTASTVSDGVHVNVGHFFSGGLYVYGSWDGNRVSIVCIASARKS